MLLLYLQLYNYYQQLMLYHQVFLAVLTLFSPCCPVLQANILQRAHMYPGGASEIENRKRSDPPQHREVLDAFRVLGYWRRKRKTSPLFEGMLLEPLDATGEGSMLDRILVPLYNILSSDKKEKERIKGVKFHNPLNYFHYPFIVCKY